MKKMFFAAIATFALVSISNVFATNIQPSNTPDGLANDTTDTTVTAPAEPEPATGNTAGDGMYLISASDTTDVPPTADEPATDSPAPADTASQAESAAL